MPSIDPDDRILALLRGEPGEQPASADEYVAARLGRVARAGDPIADEELPAPPPEVWDRVAAELGLGGADDVSGPDPARGDLPDPPPPSAEGEATVVPLASRPSRSGRSGRPWRPGRGFVLAAASVLALAAVGAALLTNRSGGSQVVAEVALQPLEGSGSGQARLVRSADGRAYLRLDQQLGSLPEGTYAEVWLIDPTSNLQRMVSLGSVDGADRLVIPRGIDPAVYRVVDVSIEPADGVPTHSGRSVLRGTMPL